MKHYDVYCVKGKYQIEVDTEDGHEVVTVIDTIDELIGLNNAMSDMVESAIEQPVPLL